MDKLEYAENKNRKNTEANGWSDMSDSLEHNKPTIDLGEIDRSTEVGWLVGATLDAYDAVADVAEQHDLSRPVVLGSGAMYMHAINSGNYAMPELNKSFTERRNFATTSHGIDIDFGLSSESEVDRLVAISGSNRRQIMTKGRDGRTRVIDLMARPPRDGFEPIPVIAGGKEVLLRNPEAMMFGKINLLNKVPASEVKQKWGYDVPMLMSVVDSYRKDNGDLNEYLATRYVDYQKAEIEFKLQQLPKEAYLSDIVTAQDVRNMLPKADDEMIQRLLDCKVGDVNVADLPAEYFNEWNEAYASAMDKYRQANILAAQHDVASVISDS